MVRSLIDNGYECVWSKERTKTGRTAIYIRRAYGALSIKKVIEGWSIAVMDEIELTTEQATALGIRA